jgi:hypothetical protein
MLLIYEKIETKAPGAETNEKLFNFFEVTHAVACRVGVIVLRLWRSGATPSHRIQTMADARSLDVRRRDGTGQSESGAAVLHATATDRPATGLLSARGRARGHDSAKSHLSSSAASNRLRAEAAESTIVGERASPAENTSTDERAIPQENTKHDQRAYPIENTKLVERATFDESAKFDQRANPCENTSSRERAIYPESTTKRERAASTKRTNPRERASQSESTKPRERANPRESTKQIERATIAKSTKVRERARSTAEFRRTTERSL